MADRTAAAALAEQIRTACYEAVIEWGDAIRKARANPDDKLAETLARVAGQQAAALAVGLSEKLGKKL